MPDAIPVPPEAAPDGVINKAVRAAGERVGVYEPGNPGFWSMFRIGLEDAAPLIAAVERERIAGLLRAAESPEDIWAIQRELTGEDGSE